jgi:hypothetical protein
MPNSSKSKTTFPAAVPVTSRVRPTQQVRTYGDDGNSLVDGTAIPDLNGVSRSYLDQPSTDEYLSVNAELTLLALRSFADDDGFCCPSVKRIARAMGRSKSTARRGIDELCRVGVVRSSMRCVSLAQDTNGYQLVAASSIGPFPSFP